MALNLDGLIPATVLPMTPDGSIDEPALRSYIAWVVEQGPVALAINVDTGEGPHLTHDEKVRILGIVRDVTHLPIVAGLAGPSTEAAENVVLWPGVSNVPLSSRSQAYVTVRPSGSEPVALTRTLPPSSTAYGPPASTIGAPFAMFSPTRTGSWSDERYGPGS